MFRLAVLLCLVVGMTSAQASPITITQTFRDVLYNDYGVETGVGYGTTPTGDWIFRGIVDSDAVNLSPWPDIGAYQLSQLSLTQASLGLFDVKIINAPTLVFYPFFFGFAYDVGGAPPWSAIYYEADHFSSADTLAEYLALITATSNNSLVAVFGPQWDGFEFEDGRRLYGIGNGVGIPSVHAVVPEPTSLALLLVVVLALVKLSHGTRQQMPAGAA